MNCMNCGAYLADMELDYCSKCGCNVLIQKKVDYLSKYYYNKGLEKASIRDLSGAITCLRQSIAYNKANIQARNLLGLVYFETGEVVAALSEWVISKNLQPNKNLASGYIEKLQANSNKLEVINDTIRKYNHALVLCREGHEDMAAIQLRKILSQNPKLIKGYHLLALIQMKEQEWSKVRKTLKKAARIDKTNTTTLRFLKEVEEQTGVATRFGKRDKGILNPGTEMNEEERAAENEYVTSYHTYKGRARFSFFFTLMLGVAAGAAAIWLLAVPAVKQNIYQEANQQIIQYSEALASQGAELTKVKGEVAQSDSTAEAAALEAEKEKKTSQTYRALFNAYYAVQQEEYDQAALEIQKVYEASLESDEAVGIYQYVCNTVGVTGIAEESDSEESEETEE